LVTNQHTQSKQQQRPKTLFSFAYDFPQIK